LRVAIITNTLYEEIVPLAKHLSEFSEIDLYSIVSRSGAGRQIFFESDDLWRNEKPGVLPPEHTDRYVNECFRSYIDGDFENLVLYFSDLSFIKPMSLRTAVRSAAYLRQKKYDVIHFNGTSLLFYVLRWLMRNRPFVLTTHDPMPHSGEDSLDYALFRKLLNRQTRIQHVLHSRELRLQFLRDYPGIPPNNVNAIYYGRHEWLNYWRQPVQAEANEILFFGRISPYKGIEYLIQAAKEIRKDVPDLKVTIVGPGNFYFDTRPLAGDTTFEIINRYVSNQELARMIQKSALVVCPYTDATQSGVVMTAFAFNKPVVSTAVGGIPEAVIDGVTGKLVPPRDGQALARAITGLLNDRRKLAELSLNIEREYSTGSFSWSHIANQTLEVYNRAISGFTH
jgi:glycosyltransferase involved in cell wall biosynthesis